MKVYEVTTEFPRPRVRKRRCDAEGDSKLTDLRRTLARMEGDMSFAAETRQEMDLAYIAAKHIGARIVTAKLALGGWRVWRVS